MQISFRPCHHVQNNLNTYFILIQRCDLAFMKLVLVVLSLNIRIYGDNRPELLKFWSDPHTALSYLDDMEYNTGLIDYFYSTFMVRLKFECSTLS